MKFYPALQEATLIKRYNRFLADVKMKDGSVATLHCPNTGSMMNCGSTGNKVWYSTAANPARKYPFTWEVVEVDSGDRIGINTALANKLVAEAIKADVIPALRGYSNLQREVPYGLEKSRIDFLLSNPELTNEICYVEVKNVTLKLDSDRGAFPDAVTERGLKHLRELITVRESGQRAVLLYCVQHSGIDRVIPADHIDPAYGKMLRVAYHVGVEVIAMGATFKTDEIALTHEVPVDLS